LEYSLLNYKNVGRVTCNISYIKLKKKKKVPATLAISPIKYWTRTRGSNPLSWFG
jgi:hypothetical protein